MVTTTINLEGFHLHIRRLVVQYKHRFSPPPISARPAIVSRIVTNQTLYFRRQNMNFLETQYPFIVEQRH